jgi:acyl-CoA synthetase (AMP-forming)/AMP-acid ligase II
MPPTSAAASDGSTTEFAYAAVWERIAAAHPERTAIIWGDRSLTWAEFDERANRLAGVLWEAGLRPAARVGIYMRNRPEYLEGVYAAWKASLVPFNINFRYVADELVYLLDNADAEAVLVDPDFRSTLDEAHGQRRGRRTVIEAGPAWESALRSVPPGPPPERPGPSGDDHLFLYTGGTTGYPKAVVWRNDDIYRAMYESVRGPGAVPPDPMRAAARGGQVAMPACPLMHGTGLFIALNALTVGGTVVLLEGDKFDAARLWAEVERSRVQTVGIVGDAFARPLLAALDADPGRWDLTSLLAIVSSGVIWSPEVKEGLRRHLPAVVMVDSLGASEGVATRDVTRPGEKPRRARFAVTERMKVFREDGVEVAAGSGEAGLLAIGGYIPVGYHKDPEKTAQTFRQFGGQRWSVPGDWVKVEDDGSIALLGRGSACINTGGEKVFPEEVEAVIRSHPAIGDCVVLGTPDERFGQSVTALVVAAGDAPVDAGDVSAFARQHLAAYKVPRRFFILDSLGRGPAGKADYRKLGEIASRLMAEAAR